MGESHPCQSMSLSNRIFFQLPGRSCKYVLTYNSDSLESGIQVPLWLFFSCLCILEESGTAVGLGCWRGYSGGGWVPENLVACSISSNLCWWLNDSPVVSRWLKGNRNLSFCGWRMSSVKSVNKEGCGSHQGFSLCSQPHLHPHCAPWWDSGWRKAGSWPLPQ